MSVIALIPARSGSKRCVNKNIRNLNGKPLISYTISYSINTKLIDKTFIVTDSIDYEKLAISYGAESIGLRPNYTATDKSTDFDWIKWFIENNKSIREDDLIFILRPTNPFRASDLIERAYEIIQTTHANSVRGVEQCKQHPMKSWVLNDSQSFMLPYSPHFINSKPAHSVQYASLPPIYIQNGCIELFPVSNIKRFQNFSGYLISPLIVNGYSGFDINYEEDFILAEALIEKNIINLS